MEYNRLSDIFVDLEAKMIANQKRLFSSFPNSSVSNIKEFQKQMFSKKSLLEKANINAVNEACGLAIDNLDKSIENGYIRGINNISTQLNKKINTKTIDRTEMMRENAHQFIKGMCRVAVSSSLAIFTNIVSSLSSYNYANDLYTAIDYAQAQDLQKGVVGNIKLNGASTNITTVADIIEGEYEHSAMMNGEGQARDEAGEHYIAISSHFGCCDKCAKWEDRVLIDDVFSNGKSDGKHPLLSQAISEGLFHPNCRHRTRLLLNGEEKGLKVKSIKDWDEEENRKQYQATQKQRLIERQIRASKRLEQGSLTQSEQMKYHQQVLHYQKVQREFIKEANAEDNNVHLFRKYERESVNWDECPKMQEDLKELAEKEKIYDINYLKLPYEEKSAIYNYTISESYKINEKLREGKQLDQYDKKLVENLNSALEKMPKVKNELLVRNINFDDEKLKEFDKQHIVGEKVTYKGFTSTTTAEVYDEKQNVFIYIQNANKASDISNVNKKEKEALYPTNSSFRVLEKDYVGDKLYILLEEI